MEKKMDFNTITIQSLKEFLVLSEIKNFAQAAEELYISQASLSRHIMRLEEALDNTLFNRTTRQIELTSFGRQFLPYALDIIKTIDQCTEDLYSTSRSDDSSIIRLGIFIPFLYDNETNYALNSFLLEHSEYAFDIHQTNEIDLIDQLEEGEIDIAFLRESNDIKDQFKRLKLSDDEPICLVVPTDYSIEGDEIKFEALRNETLIVPPTLSSPYKSFVEHCQTAGFNPKIKSGVSRESTIDMVKKHQGILVRSHLSDSIKNDPELRILKTIPTLTSSTNLVFHKSSLHKKIIADFINYMKRYYH